MFFANLHTSQLEVPNAQAHQFYNRCRDNGFGYGFLLGQRQCGQNQCRRCSTNALLVVFHVNIEAGLLIGTSWGLLFNAWRGAAARHMMRAVSASAIDSQPWVDRRAAGKGAQKGSCGARGLK
jgi:hypothetical protein